MDSEMAATAESVVFKALKVSFRTLFSAGKNAWIALHVYCGMQFAYFKVCRDGSELYALLLSFISKSYFTFHVLLESCNSALFGGHSTTTSVPYECVVSFLHWITLTSAALGLLSSGPQLLQNPEQKLKRTSQP